MGREKGYKHSVETKRKMSVAKIGNTNGFRGSEEKHYNWKGDIVGYYGIHLWVLKKKGIPKKCSTCGLENLKMKNGRRAIQWANISRDYLRDVDDWVALCIPCHREYDDM